MTRQDRIDFQSYDGEIKVQLAQGDHCVAVEIRGRYDRAAAVLTDVEAEAMGRSLIRRARYSRRPNTP